MKLVLRLFAFLALTFGSQFGFGQATMLFEDFETPGVWTQAGTPNPNFWTIEGCAGNGTSSAGSYSLYITNGGADGGCSTSGNEAFAYDNCPSGSENPIIYTQVDASCAGTLIADFDYRIEGNAGEDFLELVYSTDGVTFFPIGSALATSTNWTSTSISLPSLLDFTTFYIGFQFTYNNVNAGTFPPAIDNLTISGLDNTAPVMTCPGSLNLYVNTNCIAKCGNYTSSMLSLSDNCTDSAIISVLQDVPELTDFTGGPGSVEIITLTATDEAGNFTQCTINLNILDSFPPVIICPSDTNVYVDNNCDGTIADYTGSAAVGDNCTLPSNIIVSQSPSPGLVVHGTIVVTPIVLTAMDESGNTSTCTFDARTIDTIPATIICPLDTIVYATSTCEGYLADYTGDAIASDNCVPSSSLSVTQNPPATSIITADQVITLTVNGAIPATPQSCTFTAIFVDTLAPSLICPSPVSVYSDANCDATLPDYGTLAVYTENCDPSPVITQSPAPGTTLSGLNSTVVTITITDASGNSDMCQLTQMVLDTIKPSATCPSDQTLNTNASCQATVGDYTSMVTGLDNCSTVLSYTQNVSPGTTISANTLVTMTVTDESGNAQTCTFNLLLNDNIAPVITCPANTTVSADASCSYILGDYSASATATDNCSASGNMIYSQSPAPSTTLNTGIHTITLTVEDENSNTGSCSFDLTVEDQTSPIISSCGSNQTYNADNTCSATIGDFTAAVAVTDNCSTLSGITVTQNPVSGTTINSTTAITITVTDEAGNNATCSVNAILVDNIQPSVTCPGPQTVAINSSCEYNVPDLSGLVGGTDNCSALSSMTITQNPPAGSLQNGITSVLITLTDEGGNNATCITTLNPNDTEAPTINCPSPAPVNNGTSCDFTLPFYGSISSVLDNCSDYTITQTPAAGTVVQTGYTSIQLEVTDAGGNTDVCSFNLQVIETENPTITCPSNVSTCDPIVTYSDPVFSDNCGASLSQSDATGLSSGSTFPVGITTLEYTAVDSSGNTQTCQFNIEILDYPSSANIVDDTIWLCSQNGTVLTADPATSGSGEWTVLSGQGSFNNQFASTTGVNNLAYNTNAFIWTISSASCGSKADTVYVINSQQDLPASTQDTYACDAASIILVANAPLYGTGLWTTDGGGTINTPGSPNTSSTFTNGWQNFIWTISSGGCPSTSDTLHVFGQKQPTILTGDTLVCLGNDEIVLSATAPANGQDGSWFVASGSASIANPFSNPTTAANFGYATTLITYTYTNPSKSDTLIVSGNLCNDYQPEIPTVFTPGNLDGSNDLFTIPFLGVLYPECKVLIFNRWGSVVYESTGYDEPWDGTYKGESLPMGTYFYQIDLNDGSGTQYKGDISIIK